MTQISRHYLSKEVQKRMYEVFLEALVDINNPKSADIFTNDFFTPTERVMLPKRLAIALLLAKNYDQRQISQLLKVSFTTITRINNILKTQGEGYRKVINKILSDEKLSDFIEKIDDTLAKILGPAGPGSSNWNSWYKNRRDDKLRSKKPF